MGRRVVLWMSALVLLASTVHAETRIRARCEVTVAGSQCTFTNTGTDRGSGCATVVVTHHGDQHTYRSGQACSGELAGGASGGQVSLQFTEDVPTICSAPVAGGIQANCDLRVEMSDVQDDAVASGAGVAGGLCSLVAWLMVIGSAVWVFRDARRRNIDNPGMWAFATAFVWIVVFPLYLFRRKSMQAQPGFNPVPGPYGAPMGYAGQPGVPPGQPGGFAQQGGYPQQGFGAPPGGFPPQGAYPQQGFGAPPGGYAQPGGFPQQGAGPQPGGFPQQGFAPQPGGFPQQGFAPQPVGFPPAGAQPPVSYPPTAMQPQQGGAAPVPGAPGQNSYPATQAIDISALPPGVYTPPPGGNPPWGGGAPPQ